MLIAILFWSLCVGACLYALLLGGWAGRWMTIIILAATFATMAIERLLGFYWHDTNQIVALVDLATFLAMYWVVARSKLWWPVWVAAFQLNSVAAHVATLISPEFSALIYQGYEGMWAIPLLLFMVIGVHRDRVWKINYDLA